MNYCDKCGNELKPESLFCSNCGTHIEEHEHEVPENTGDTYVYEPEIYEEPGNGQNQLAQIPYSQQELMRMLYTIMSFYDITPKTQVMTDQVNPVSPSSPIPPPPPTAPFATAGNPAGGIINLYINGTGADTAGGAVSEQQKQTQPEQRHNVDKRNAAPLQNPTQAAGKQQRTPPPRKGSSVTVPVVNEAPRPQPRPSAQPQKPKPQQKPQAAPQNKNPQAQRFEQPVYNASDPIIAAMYGGKPPKRTKESSVRDDNRRNAQRGNTATQKKGNGKRKNRTDEWDMYDSIYGDEIPADGGATRSNATRKQAIKISLVVGLAVAAILMFYIVPRIFG